jgi:ankyrin repeat protein
LEVVALLAAGASANTLSPDAETPLHVAAITGDPATVAALLAHGGDPNARAPGGVQRAMAPIHWAAYGGHAEMVKALLGAGADGRLADDTGMDALGMAKEAGHAGVVRVLEEWANAAAPAEL